LDCVYIAYALDDGDEVGPLAAMLRGAGYSVRFGPVVEPGVNHRERIEKEIKGAVAVLAIWSSHSVVSPRVRDDAAFAADWGNLIAVRIDAAAMPVTNGAVVDLSGGERLSSGPGAQAILGAIDMLPKVPARPAAGLPLHDTPAGVVEAGKAREWRGLIVVSAIAIVGLGALGVSMMVSPATGAATKIPATDSAAVTGAASVAAASGMREDPAKDVAGEALLVWTSLPKNDPMALREFLALHGQAPVAEQARGALARLERVAWDGVVAHRDSAGALSALEVYRAEYPDGLFLSEASVIETRERRRISEAQERLQLAGLLRSEPDGILKPETVNAVRSFQASLGLPATGLIDASLMQALRAGGAAVEPGPATAAEPPPGPAPQPVAGAPFRDCYVCPELVPLPAGSFVMGDATGAAPADERPAHQVRLAYRLAIGRFEVTFEEWDACIGDGGCRHRPSDAGKGRGNRPVVDVAPADIAEYLAWLSRKTGKRYRLPSEAEWEYAARAGEASAWHSGNAPDNLCAYGNGADASSSYAWRNTGCSDRFADTAAPVGSFRPNRFGLHDVMGNVWEWTADCWHASYADAPGDGSAWVRDCDTPDMVLRGGAYSVDIDKMRSSYRYHFAPRRMPFFGFRVARQFD
jgi:formylglycine-generating enzyme required for sulfatase activity